MNHQSLSFHANVMQVEQKRRVIICNSFRFLHRELKLQLTSSSPLLLLKKDVKVTVEWLTKVDSIENHYDLTELVLANLGSQTDGQNEHNMRHFPL